MDQQLAQKWCSDCHAVGAEDAEAYGFVPSFVLIAEMCFSIGGLTWYSRRSTVPGLRRGTHELVARLFSIRAVVVKRFQANNSNFCRSRARASLRDQPLALPAWDQQEETEQSDSRTDRGRAIDTRAQSKLVSSTVPRGTSLRWIVVLVASDGLAFVAQIVGTISLV